LRRKAVRVLVAGATGFIGSRVCRTLAADGHEVAALSRNPDSARAKLPGLSEAFSWSPPETGPPRRALAWADAVLNFAGESVAGVWTRAKKRRVVRSRVGATSSLVEAMGRTAQTPSVFVCAGAVGYYGDRGEDELKESEPPGTGVFSELCARWEAEALKAENLGVRVVILRIGLVLGTEGGLLRALLPAAKLGLTGRMGSGRQWWPWVHADDVTGLVRFALATEMAGPFNATSPNPVRQEEFARTLAGVLRRPCLLNLPSFVLSAAGAAAAASLESTRAVPYRAMQAGYEHAYKDLVTALAHLLGRS